MKLAISISTLLLFTLTILITFQYEAFSFEKADQPIHFTYDQEVEVTVQQGTLQVVHNLRGLPNSQLSLLWPTIHGQAQCATGTNCERLTPDLSTITEGEEQNLSVSYEIPIKVAEDIIIHSTPFLRIQGGEVDQTVLHVTDRINSGGTWLTGLPIIGQQTMAYVDYILFAGEGEVDELYWQKEPLSLTYKNKSISLYSHEMPADSLKKMLDSVSFSKHVDVIVSEQRHPHTNRVLFIRQGVEEEVKRDLAIATLQSSFDFRKEESVLLSILANLLTGQEEGNNQAKLMTHELNKLPKEQKNAFLNKLQGRDDRELNSPRLDSILSEVLNGPVSFFERNRSNRQLFPLVLDEDRPVAFEGTPVELDVIKMDGRIYYALPELMETMKYSMKEGEHGLYLDNGMRSFRFPVNEPFYVLNERRYDAPTEPIVKIAGNYYIEEKWLSLLFLIDVKEGTEQIRLERLDGF